MNIIPKPVMDSNYGLDYYIQFEDASKDQFVPGTNYSRAGQLLHVKRYGITLTGICERSQLYTSGKVQHTIRLSSIYTTPDGYLISYVWCNEDELICS